MPVCKVACIREKWKKLAFRVAKLGKSKDSFILYAYWSQHLSHKMNFLWFEESGSRMTPPPPPSLSCFDTFLLMAILQHYDLPEFVYRLSSLESQNCILMSRSSLPSLLEFYTTFKTPHKLQLSDFLNILGYSFLQLFNWWLFVTLWSIFFKISSDCLLSWYFSYLESSMCPKENG